MDSADESAREKLGDKSANRTKDLQKTKETMGKETTKAVGEKREETMAEKREKTVGEKRSETVEERRKKAVGEKREKSVVDSANQSNKNVETAIASN